MKKNFFPLSHIALTCKNFSSISFFPKINNMARYRRGYRRRGNGLRRSGGKLNMKKLARNIGKARSFYKKHEKTIKPFLDPLKKKAITYAKKKALEVAKRKLKL